MENYNYLSEIDRNHILKELMDNYNELKQKLEHGRVKNVENEKIKIQWYKILVQIARAMNDILKDKQIDEIKEDLLILKETLNNSTSLKTISENSSTDKLIATIEALK